MKPSFKFYSPEKQAIAENSTVDCSCCCVPFLYMLWFKISNKFNSKTPMLTIERNEGMNFWDWKVLLHIVGDTIKQMNEDESTNNMSWKIDGSYSENAFSAASNSKKWSIFSEKDRPMVGAFLKNFMYNIYTNNYFAFGSGRHVSKDIMKDIMVAAIDDNAFSRWDPYALTAFNRFLICFANKTSNSNGLDRYELQLAILSDQEKALLVYGFSNKLKTGIYIPADICHLIQKSIVTWKDVKASMNNLFQERGITDSESSIVVDEDDIDSPTLRHAC